jgi:hypothetical protein
MRPTPAAPAVPGEGAALPGASASVTIAVQSVAAAELPDLATHDREVELRPPGGLDAVPLYLSDRSIRR